VPAVEELPPPEELVTEGAVAVTFG
jgi:hypothetical protein